MSTSNKVFFRNEDGELFSAESSVDQNNVVTTAVEKVEDAPLIEPAPANPLGSLDA